LLGIRDDGNLRVMAKGGRDCIELTPDGDRWPSEDGGYFEIESVTGEGWPELAEFLATFRRKIRFSVKGEFRAGYLKNGEKPGGCCRRASSA